MNPPITHRLLQRQIQRHLGESTIPESWYPFIKAIDQAYYQADNDLIRVERTLEISSQELLEANAKLQTVLQSVEQQVQERTEELSRSLQVANLLQQLTTEIRSTLDSNVILQTIVQKVRAFLHADRVVIYRFTRQYQGEVVVEDVAANQLSILGEVYDDICFPLEHALKYHSHSYVRAVNDVAQSNLHPCHINFLKNIQVKANLVTPICLNGELWGLLIVHECTSTRIWQDSEVNILQQVADQAAIAIQQANLYEQSQRSAQTAILQKIQLEEALENLQQTQMQLIQTEKMSSLGQLVAGVAHEINNPVNFIYGNLSYASEYVEEILKLVQLYQSYYPNPAPEIKAALDRSDLDFMIEDFTKLMTSMQMGVDRIRQIVQGLRNFSRMDEAEMKVVNIHEGIDSTLLILQHRLQTKKTNTPIEIVRNYGNLPPVDCYAGQLNQVFMNVLANAIDALEESTKFSHVNNFEVDLVEAKIQKARQRTCCLGLLQEQQKPTIWIQTDHSSPNQVTVRIIDNGSGIPASIKTQLFNPFFTTKEVGKGTGLGLSISYQIIVDRHQGSLTCESIPGVGTEFVITIPISQPH